MSLVLTATVLVCLSAWKRTDFGNDHFYIYLSAVTEFCLRSCRGALRHCLAHGFDEILFFYLLHPREGAISQVHHTCFPFSQARTRVLSQSKWSGEGGEGEDGGGVGDDEDGGGEEEGGVGGGGDDVDGACG